MEDGSSMSAMLVWFIVALFKNILWVVSLIMQLGEISKKKYEANTDSKTTKTEAYTPYAYLAGIGGRFTTHYISETELIKNVLDINKVKGVPTIKSPPNTFENIKKGQDNVNYSSMLISQLLILLSFVFLTFFFVAFACFYTGASQSSKKNKSDSVLQLKTPNVTAGIFVSVIGIVILISAFAYLMTQNRLYIGNKKEAIFDLLNGFIFVEEGYKLLEDGDKPESGGGGGDEGGEGEAGGEGGDEGAGGGEGGGGDEGAGGGEGGDEGAGGEDAVAGANEGAGGEGE